LDCLRVTWLVGLITDNIIVSQHFPEQDMISIVADYEQWIANYQSLSVEEKIATAQVIAAPKQLRFGY